MTRGRALPKFHISNHNLTRNMDKTPNSPKAFPFTPSTLLKTTFPKPMSPTLTALPPELLRQILFHADYKTLTTLSETCHQLHTETTCESLWRHLAQRRFRVSSNTPSSRRLRAAGPISWRTLYANWHMHRRMPISRHSGPTFRAFAKGGSGGVLIWVTVPSADDSRLRAGVLKVTVIVQNVSCKRLGIFEDGIDVVLANRVVKGRVCEWDVEGEIGWLEKDQILLAAVEVEVPGAVFEVDALEQMLEIRARVEGHKDGQVVAKFVEKEIWDAYDLLPGGWWVRVN